eukprot:scaffold7648_cov86-Skeletonema_dohrnii-CCMP3373.AAC.1
MSMSLSSKSVLKSVASPLSMLAAGARLPMNYVDGRSTLYAFGFRHNISSQVTIKLMRSQV